MGLKESGLRASVRSVSTVVPAFFDVAITDTNSPINEGDVLVVDYSVDNTGDSFETQDIRLEIDSVQEDADLDVSLSGGASDTGTLEWDTTGQGADTYEATLLSDDDSDTVTVEIPDAFFDVAIQSTNSPVEEGETLNVDYLVDNTGGVEGTQDIRLEIDNTQEDVDTGVTLDSGTSTTGTLQWDTTNESADTYSATVLSDDDSDTVTVEIESGIPDSVTDYWPMDEGTGSVAANNLGSADIDLIGAGWADDGFADGHTTYDGTDDIFRVESGAPANQANCTVMMWFRWESAGSFDQILSTAADEQQVPNNGYRVTHLGRGGEVRVYSDGSESTPIDGFAFDSLPTNEWLFIALSWELDGIDLYVWDRESQLRSESGDEGTGTREDGDERLSGMGPPSQDRNLQGDVGEVWMSDQTLSESEIKDVWDVTR